MYFINRVKIRRTFSLLLVVALLVSLCPMVSAIPNNYVLDCFVLDESEHIHALRVMYSDGIWFGAAEDLAAIVQGSTERRQYTQYFFSAEETQLTKAQSAQYIDLDGVCFVVLSPICEKLGLYFYADNGVPKVERVCTDAMLLEKMDNIFNTQQYYVGNVMEDTAGWEFLEALAWSYSNLSQFSLSAWFNAFTGKQHQEFFDAAFATILATDGSAMAAIQGVSTLNKIGKNGAELEDILLKLLEDKGELGDILREYGVDEAALQWYLSGSTDESWLQTYSKVSETLKLEAFLDAIGLYAAVADTEVAMLQAAQFAFEDSEHPLIRSSIKRIMSNRFGDGGLAVLDVYGNSTFDSVVDTIAKRVGKLLSEKKNKKEELTETILQAVVTTAADYGFQMSDKVDATLMLRVYADIQADLHSYYWEHRNDTEEDTIQRLRSAAILYLKSAIAVYENFAFDQGVEETVKKALRILTGELTGVLDYTDSEKINIQGFIDYLDLTWNGEMALRTNSSTNVPEMQDNNNTPDNAYLSMDLCWYGQTGSVIELPQICGTSSAAAQKINQEISAWYDDLTLQYEYMPESWRTCEVYSDLYESSNYLSVVSVFNEYPTYGTDGFLYVWVYDKVNQSEFTLDQAYAWIGKSETQIVSDMKNFVESKLSDFHGIEKIAAYFDEDGNLVFIAEVNIGDWEVSPGWTSMIEWENGECRLVTK